ncbi:hypothetical protein N7478_007280 [Penicillium angulare]|uniref:uncharacterized protein n=1 Tax=Penicillium angulare TaxID=116970 RepID=UPI0025414261|nr:uncharacterized protein N7478_007280 [Penicillium angulare]KAJ5281908.1 hypothetical protein N7478_007280 [Penicillium angulare]
MSLRPHRFVHPRLNGLLAARCSNLARSDWRPRALDIAYKTRNFYSSGAPAISTPGEDYRLQTTTNSALHLKPGHDALTSSHSVEEAGQKSISTTQPEQTHNDELPPKTTTRNPRKAVSRRLNNQIVQDTLIAHGLDPALADSVTQRLNKAIKKEMNGRHLDFNRLRLATLLRANSLYSNIRGSCEQWKLMYEQVSDAKYYKAEIQNKAAVPGLGREGKRLLEEKIQVDCLGSFREEWRAMSRESRASVWQRLAIWLLQNDTRLLLEFLSVTAEGDLRPDFTMLVDCLCYVDTFYYQKDPNWLDNWQNGARTYHSIIQSCLDPYHWPLVSLPQRGPRLYIRRANHDALCLGLKVAKERFIDLYSGSALYFAWRFTNLGDVDRALESLALLPSITKEHEPGFDINSEIVHRHCCKLLTLDTVEEGSEGRNFKILPQLLEMGIKPDRDMLNVVLHNAYKNDSHLGADILKFMEGHGYSLDSYSYLTLLSDSVARGDRSKVDSLIREVSSNEELRQNPWIASKIFHSYYLFTVKTMDAESDPSAVFYAMLDMYNEIHDLTPLKELTIVPHRYVPRSEGVKSPPSTVALLLVLATYFRCQNRYSNVQRIYSRFRELVAQGHPTIAPMAKTDHMHNEFIIAFRHSPRGLRSCVHVVEDMLALPNLLETQDGQTVIPEKPTISTWTLLMGAFVYNRQVDAAEKIREMMDKHNVRYNDRTWNTIINGYANAQNIPETAAAIKAMEEQGFTIDSFTMNHLRYLRDPERLWVAVEELDQKAMEISEADLAPDSELGFINRQEQFDQLVDNGLEKLGSKFSHKA